LIDVSEQFFQQFVFAGSSDQTVHGTSRSAPMNTDEPLPTRRSLLDRLKDAGDHASWEDFHRTYHGLIFGVARRAGLNEHEAAEAVQDTFIAVAKKLPEFRYEPGQDSFKGWLLQVTRWKVADQFRQRKAGAGSGLPDENSERSSVILPSQSVQALEDFQAVWNAEWEQHLLAQALARVKRQVNPEHYAIYHLNVIEERPATEVRQTLGVGIAAIYLAKHRVGSAVKQELRRLRDAEL
jgi:RNA polymerase sigma factor (sigma-70 family)